MTSMYCQKGNLRQNVHAEPSHAIRALFGSKLQAGQTARRCRLLPRLIATTTARASLEVRDLGWIIGVPSFGLTSNHITRRAYENTLSDPVKSAPVRGHRVRVCDTGPSPDAHTGEPIHPTPAGPDARTVGLRTVTIRTLGLRTVTIRTLGLRTVTIRRRVSLRAMTMTMTVRQRLGVGSGKLPGEDCGHQEMHGLIYPSVRRSGFRSWTQRMLRSPYCSSPCGSPRTANREMAQAARSEVDTV